MVVHAGTSSYSYGVYDLSGTEIASGSGSRKRTGTYDAPLVIGDDFTGYIRGVEVEEERFDLEVRYMSEASYTGATKFGASFTESAYNG